MTILFRRGVYISQGALLLLLRSYDPRLSAARRNAQTSRKIHRQLITG